MKLFQTYDSPFPTRVRLLLYAKGIEAEIIQPPGFHASVETKDEYLKINPIGRVPTLVLDNGRALPESEVICEYLEDAYPEPSLRPDDPWERARMRLLSRICDFYVVMAMVPLFTLAGRSRRHWEPEVVNAAVGKLAEALAYLEDFIGEEGYAIGRSLTQADGAIAPQLVLASEWIPGLFGTPDPLATLPRLAAYWRAIQTDPIAARLIAETRDAIAEQQAAAKARASAERIAT
ncbi:MAG: glutathione S-transferase family protein [Phenylobacterium sp.]|uniref:glutathione S-transferase family protein n=1 Tax=Phenylobacterium sp. TaxID=1871053 RepID=UPI0027373C21|nr:glutathione S-transferase family protein [Phenylobacterium sp.]MDP3745473.1 glutathione S-transferase family protein [Phenylobacterium sp.]